jgi:rhodanese-related sulfurtransferase
LFQFEEAGVPPTFTEVSQVPKEVGLDDIRTLLDQGAQLVEVLPEQEFQTEHLAGAVNLPLKKIDRKATEFLDPQRPVIVYCWDYQ